MFQRRLALESSRKVSLSMQKLKPPELRLTMKGAHCLAQSCTAHSRLYSSACREVSSWLAVVWGFSRAAAALWGMCTSQAKHSQAICKVCWTESLQINLEKINWKRNLPKHAKPGYETPVKKALKLIDVATPAHNWAQSGLKEFAFKKCLDRPILCRNPSSRLELGWNKSCHKTKRFVCLLSSELCYSSLSTLSSLKMDHVNIHVRHVTFLKLTTTFGAVFGTMSRISHTALLLATATWPQAGQNCGRNSAICHRHVALLQNLHLLISPTLSPNFKLANMHHHFETALFVSSS